LTSPSLPERAALAVLLGGALLLAGCGGAEEPGPPSIEESERRLGAEQHPLLLAEFGGAYSGEESRYMAGVGEKLAGHAGLGGECTFTLVNSDVVNAFAVPGCYIYITRGLMGIVNSEAEMASVLAHELGHIVGDHSERQQKRSILRGLGVLAVGLLTGSERLAQVAGKAAEYFTLRYSRKQEYQSDDLGLRYLSAAGYDPHAASDMLASLARHERFLTTTAGRDEAQSIPEWARTHPLTENRIGRASAAASALGVGPDEMPEQEREYLTELDGLLYGDDPQQGFVMGRRFAHPVMRIGFEAPQGFTLTNSTRAILIGGPDGMRGEFAGGAIPSGGLEAYVSAVLQQLLGEAQPQLGRPERGVVNGVPALFVQAVVETQRGTVELSVAAYSADGRNAYHFVMIAPPSEQGAAASSALFHSFRILTETEARSLKPRQIRVIRVRQEDRLETLAEAMVSDHPREHFLMLNARTADQPLKPGELVKLVRLAGQ